VVRVAEITGTCSDAVATAFAAGQPSPERMATLLADADMVVADEGVPA
jgi:hypothetical protein